MRFERLRRKTTEGDSSAEPESLYGLALVLRSSRCEEGISRRCLVGTEGLFERLRRKTMGGGGSLESESLYGLALVLRPSTGKKAIPWGSPTGTEGHFERLPRWAAGGDDSLEPESAYLISWRPRSERRLSSNESSEPEFLNGGRDGSSCGSGASSKLAAIRAP